MKSTPASRSILVTGGAGFVGSSICVHLARTWADCQVVALDNLKRRGSELNLNRLKDAGVNFIHGDVRNRADMDELPRMDVVIDCSAEPSVMAGLNGGVDYVVDTNLGGTQNCLRIAARDQADLLFLSTSRVYPVDRLNRACQEERGCFAISPGTGIIGLGERGVAEDFPLDGVRTLYGATKLASELLIQEYAHLFGFRAVVNRCGVVAGPWQMGKTDQGFALLWLSRHHWGLPLDYIGYGGTGHQVRDLLHVDDLCDLVVRQLDNMDRVAGNTYNVGGGKINSTSLKEFTTLCETISGRRIHIGSIPQERPGDLKLYITDNSKVTDATGWTPKRDVRAILSDSFEWLKAHDAVLRTIMT